MKRKHLTALMTDSIVLGAGTTALAVAVVVTDVAVPPLGVVRDGAAGITYFVADGSEAIEREIQALQSDMPLPSEPVVSG